jgi:outer membrane beta-barrel protein
MSGAGMVRLGVRLASAVLTVSLVTTTANAREVIEFPDEELAAESVLPLFDTPDSVKNRRIVTAKKIEFGAQGGLSLVEPVFNELSFGVSGTYHFDEIYGVNLYGSFFMPGLNGNGVNLSKATNEQGNPIDLRVDNAPAPSYLLLANYQYTPFYGKISLAKDAVMNLSLFGFAGAGAMGIGDSVYPVLNAGLGQKFYITRQLALRFDLRFLINRGPNIISQKLEGESRKLPNSEFETKTSFSSILSFGAVYLFPSL